MSLQGILALCRVSNLPTVWMNVVTAVVLLGLGTPLPAMLLLAFSMSAFYCAGMAFNDVFDAHTDAESQPFRPIPSGRISYRQALTVASLLMATGLLSLLAAPHASAGLGGVALATTILLYNRFHKAHASTVILMAACRFLIYPICSWAMVGSIEPVVIVAGALQFFYTLLLTVVARWEQHHPRPGLIPRMIAGMCWLDGLFLAVAVDPKWLLVGIVGFALTRAGQRWWVRGD